MEAVSRFQEYLRQKSVHPNPDYDGCINWIQGQAQEIGLDFNIVEFDGHKSFAIWLTWKGKDPELESVLLNSHIDVVPVDSVKALRDPAKWTHDPFEAFKDEKGNIYARGSQDMKCMGAQYLEAIRNLKAKGYTPLRNVHVSFVPDEEVGGQLGMAPFVASIEFRNLKVGFVLDEGIASPDDSFNLFYGERTCCAVNFRARGQTGHGSLLPENTAAEKIRIVINKMLDLRQEEKERLEANKLSLGDVTTINLTMLNGGLQDNIVPPELSALFDIRASPTWGRSHVDSLLRGVCKAAGPEVTFEYLYEAQDGVKATELTKENPWWMAFKDGADEIGIQLNELIFPAATDSRFLRKIGIPALGFSPMNSTPVLLHDHDEYLNENIYLRGIQIYEHILPRVFDVLGY